jgi:hypothetical protein
MRFSTRSFGPRTAGFGTRKLSLLTPEAGYYQTVSRLVAIVSQFFPLSYGPAVFNLAALLAKLLVVNFLISSRLRNLVPSLSLRLLIAFLYIALPHSFETHANLTNVQWHLGLLTFLIIVAERIDTVGWRVFDYAMVALSAFSGPLCILLTPIAVVKFLNDRKRSTLVISAILTLGALVQIFSLLITERPSPQPLGANLGLGLKIIAGHLFISSFFGEQGHGFLVNRSLLNDATAVVINILGIAAVVYAFIISRIELRLLIVFSLMIVVAAMASPALTSDVPQWTVMWLPVGGSRYWLIPMFCLMLTVLYLAKEGEYKPVRVAAIAALIASLAGIAADWKYPPFEDLNFQEHAARFESASRGEEVVIPINPNWDMRLTKK